jgi:hypothetical protein
VFAGRIVTTGSLTNGRGYSPAPLIASRTLPRDRSRRTAATAPTSPPQLHRAIASVCPAARHTLTPDVQSGGSVVMHLIALLLQAEPAPWSWLELRRPVKRVEPLLRRP